MLKMGLIGGLLAALSISSFGLGDLFLGLIGLGVALFVLAVVIDIVAEVLERVERRWGSMHHGFSARL